MLDLTFLEDILLKYAKSLQNIHNFEPAILLLVVYAKENNRNLLRKLFFSALPIIQ